MAIARGATGTVGATPLVDRPPRLDELLEVLRGEVPAWHADAACLGRPDAVNFFPGRGQGTAAARRICAKCLVRRECLEYALEHEDSGEAHGVWGGTTPSRRREIRAGRLTIDQALEKARNETEAPPEGRTVRSPDEAPVTAVPSCVGCGLPISPKRTTGRCRRCEVA